MGIIKSMGHGLKKFVDVKRWSDWRTIMDSARGIRTLVTDLKPMATERKETFEEAVKRLKLDENRLRLQAKNFLRLSLSYFGFGILLMIYTFYLALESHWRAALLGLVVTSLALLFAYRESFYYFQIKRRKLGCSFKEWLQFVLKGFKL